MKSAAISGWGKCLPPTIVTNDELATFINTSDHWITTRTGIKERRYSHIDTSVLAAVAAQHALACAGLHAEDIDFILIATTSPDSLIPNIASKVQQEIGAQCGAMDLNAACSGFLYALGIANAFIKSEQYKHVLVIGAERLSFYLDWTRRDTAVLFGDGAGAVVVSARESDEGILHYNLLNEASQRHIITSSFGTQINRFNAHFLDFYIHFEGPEIFKRAIQGMNQLCHDTLQATCMTTEDIHWVLPHQANLRIINALMCKLKIPTEKAITNIHKYGNTSAATIPIALCEALESGQIKPHQHILSTAFGAGLSCAAALIKWGERVEPIQQSTAQVEPCQYNLLDEIKKQYDDFSTHHSSTK